MPQLSSIPSLQLVVMLAMAEEKNEPLLARELEQIPGVKLKLAEPLARYTSMKIGGPADYFVEIASEAALADALRALERSGTELYLLGNGSNVLISDRGVRGAVMRLTGGFKTVEWRASDRA